MTMSTETKGLKFDDEKQKWFAMPLEILEPLADVFIAGEEKYGLFNCLQPFDDWSRRFYDAGQRHRVAAQINPLAIDDGEDGTGCYHLAQSAFSDLLRLHNALREKREMEEKKVNLETGNLK